MEGTLNCLNVHLPKRGSERNKTRAGKCCFDDRSDLFSNCLLLFMKRVVFSERCLDYSYFGHVEDPERVRRAYEILKSRGYEFLEPEHASQDDLLRAHSKVWIERVKRGGFFDGDTPGGSDIYEYASLSAGGAIVAAREPAFSLMRPPGHHAGRSGRALGAPTLGFCYLNNMAVAVKCLNKPTLILDIDGHHGNGTEEIFQGDPNVKVISLHRVGIYPGTGYESEGNCLNFPFFTPPGEELYLRTLDKALNHVDMKEVEVVAVSAGFDCHNGDLASLGLSSNCFREIGKKVQALGRHTFGVLEGGYDGEHVGEDLDRFLNELPG